MVVGVWSSAMPRLPASLGCMSSRANWKCVCQADANRGSTRCGMRKVVGRIALRVKVGLPGLATRCCLHFCTIFHSAFKYLLCRGCWTRATWHTYAAREEPKTRISARYRSTRSARPPSAHGMSKKGAIPDAWDDDWVNLADVRSTNTVFRDRLLTDRSMPRPRPSQIYPNSAKQRNARNTTRYRNSYGTRRRTPIVCTG